MIRDAAALARKDLLLELRGRETLPSMALFVAAMLVAFRFALPLFQAFFGGVDAPMLAAIAFADVGLCALGTLLAAMVVAGRAREVLLPLLFLPLTLPIVAGGVGATVTDDPARYLAFLGLYDAIFAILAWATFEYVVTE